MTQAALAGHGKKQSEIVPIEVHFIHETNVTIYFSDVTVVAVECWDLAKGRPTMKLFETELSPLGMGCWPIGGPMFGGPGFGNCGTLGYANSDDAESIKTIHAALANGIRLFDTAAVYGAGVGWVVLSRHFLFAEAPSRRLVGQMSLDDMKASQECRGTVMLRL